MCHLLTSLVSGDMEIKFKPGDRIVVIENGHQLTVGMTGTVLEHSTAPWIDWDQYRSFMYETTRAVQHRWPKAKALWCSSQHRLALDGNVNIDRSPKSREW